MIYAHIELLRNGRPGQRWATCIFGGASYRFFLRFFNFGKIMSAQESGNEIITTVVLLFLILIVLAFIIVQQVPGLFRKKGDVILFTGLVNAGKTALFCALQPNGVFRKTYMSMIPNEKKMVPRGITHPEAAKWTWVDYPGHGSLRSGLQPYLSRARAVIYVMDSSLEAELQNAAAELAQLLSGELALRQVPLLIACSKTDAEQALGLQDVQARLTQLITHKVTMQNAELADLAGSSSSAKVQLPADFTFSKARCPVSFARVSAKHQDLSPILEFNNDCILLSINVVLKYQTVSLSFIVHCLRKAALVTC
eukprot:g12245.t1